MIKKFKDYIILNESRKEDIKRMLSMRETIAKHCIKLYLYPDSEYVFHWMKEIRGFFSTIHNLKDVNRNYDLYFSNLCYIKDIYDIDYTSEGYMVYVDIYDDILSEYTIVPSRDDLITSLRWYVKFIEQVIPIIIPKKYDEDAVFDLLHLIYEIPE